MVHMNPNASSETEGFQLSVAPMERSASSPTAQGEATPTIVERAAVVGAAAERAPGPSSRQAPPLALPSIALPVLPMPVATDPPQDDTQAASAQLSTKTSLINDSDLIEKEWVDKAKQIVEHTRDDPYKQSEELTIFKADYMKKHYDKSIKLK
jgi:hypothetical protein